MNISKLNMPKMENLNELGETVRGLPKQIMERPVVAASTAAVALGAAAASVYFFYGKHLDFPGPGRHSLFKFFSAFAIDGDNWITLKKLEEKYGQVYTLHSVVYNALVVSDPKVIGDIVTNIDLFQKPTMMGAVQDVFGPSIFFKNNPEWKYHRRALLTGFKAKNLRFGFSVQMRKTTELIGTWERDKEGEHIVVDIRAEVDKLLVDVAGLELFNCDFGAVTHNDLSGLQAQEDMEEYMASRRALPRWLARYIRPMTEKAKRGKYWWTSRIDQAIAQRAEAVKNGDNESLVADLLDALLASGFDNENIHGELMGTFMASKFSTPPTLCLVLHAFSQRPDLAKQAREEVLGEFGDSPNGWQYEGLAKLRLIDCVIKETLRHYNATALSIRQTSADTTIWGRHVPKGTIVMIEMMGVHMNPQYYEDPESFKPERWLNAEEWYKPGTYGPFLDGPRRCVGEKLAISTLKVATAQLLLQYEWEEVPGQEPLVIKNRRAAKFPSRKYIFKRRT